MSVHEPTGIFFGKVKNRLRDFGFEVFFLHDSQYYYPTLLVDVQKMHKRSTNITHLVICTEENLSYRLAIMFSPCASYKTCTLSRQALWAR